MSAKKYVPNRLRGVLGGDDPSPSGRASSTRGKGRKSRPWRVDAASWKQQLQERKAVYDNFALQERAEEEKEASSSQVPEKKEFESIPLNVLTSTMAQGGGRVETMLTPRGGGQVETVYTSSSSTSVAKEETANSYNDNDGKKTSEKSPTKMNSATSSSPSSTTSSLSPKKAFPRRSSPLPRKRRSLRKGKKSDIRRTSSNDSSDDENWSNEDEDEDDVMSSRSTRSSDSQEYYIDVTELQSSKSKDSNVAIVNGAAYEKEQVKKNRIQTRSRHRRSISDDTLESVGFPGGELGDSSTEYPVDKSSMMEAVENFIDTSRANSKSFDEKVGPRGQSFARNGTSREIINRENSVRRGGRRRNRTSPNGSTPQLSPATSTTSTAGTIMGNSTYGDAKYQSLKRPPNAQNNDATSGGDDEWSIRPVPSEEDICLEKRRWPLRPDADAATVSSGDSDLISEDENYGKAKKGVNFNPRDDVAIENLRKERTSVSLSPASRKNKVMVRSSSERQIRQSEETSLATGATPDPLQRARKTLLMSNLNRSVRSLDTSSNSRQDNETVGDSSIESSYSASIFVPLRSHRFSSSQGGGKREIALNVLDNHGVYVSKYNESGIFVPPSEDSGKSAVETPKKESVNDKYNEHGAYVPQDKAASLLEDILGDDSDAEELPGEKEATAGNSETITNVDSRDSNNENAVHTRGKLDVEDTSKESDSEILDKEGNVNAAKSEDISTSQEEQPCESTSSKSVSADESLVQEGATSIEPDTKDDENEVEQTTQSHSDQNQIVEGTENNENGTCGVDEIDANRIRLVSDLKRYVSTIYIGNHVCVESIGTSKEADPLDTLRRKRAAMKYTVNIHLKAQLNDTVLALNTDHHHVIESPGKMISGKGKKWKERMAMKKLSKKINADAKTEEKSNMPPVESRVDDFIMDEGSKDNVYTSDPVTENVADETGGERLEDVKEADENQSLSKADTTVTDAPNTSLGMTDNTHAENPIETTNDRKESDVAAMDDTSGKPSELPEESKHIDAIAPQEVPSFSEEKSPLEDPQPLTEKAVNSSVDSSSQKLAKANADSIDTVSSTQEVQEPSTSSTLPESTIVADNSTPTADVLADVIGFSPSAEGQEIGADLPLSGNDNNIIQGLPPNKGKKWKDRLKKKKNKKSEKNGDPVKDSLESDEGALKSIEVAKGDHMEQTILASTSDGNTNIATDTNSKARPPFNRGISDLTTEEKQRAVSPTNEAQVETSPKNAGKKSNKWKNRLAKMKGCKQESTKSEQADVQNGRQNGLKPDLPTDSSDKRQTLDKTDVLDNKPITKIELPLVEPGAPEANPQTLTMAPNGFDLMEKTETSTPTETVTNPIPSEEDKSSAETPTEKGKVQEPNIQKNLRQSFDVFEKFLQHGTTNPVDDESIYTEMTIGQESLLQSGLPVSQPSEEELSYMDFTYEESVQPVQRTSPSQIPGKDQMMSPFMANLLSSRMFQDDSAPVPKMSLSPKEKQPDEKHISVVHSPGEDLKKYPTITVGDAFDDEMTQITMGSLEDQNQNEDEEEEFFDAESNALPRSPSSKSLGKKSKRSTNSQGASSTSSPLSCSEASKQRIVEILRKEVWSRDTNVVKSAMEELDSEAKNGYDHRAHIVRCGGVMTIMRAMEMNSNCEAIQISSCSTLEKLALEPQTQIAICEMEGISLIVRSMQVNVENVNLQEAACSALATICRHHEGNSSKDLMKDAEDAVPTILSCMTRHQTNSYIQAKGFQAIANLCSGTHAHQRLEELSKAGGIMTLTMAIQTPWENKNDQQEAISNLSILLRGITELNEKLSLMPARNAVSKDVNQDGTGAKRNEIEASASDETNGEGATDNETVISYMEEIPNMPMMSTMSINGEEIPDLDQYPTMMSNLEWQNFGEDDLDAGRKMSENPASPARSQQSGADGTQRPGEEQCTIQ